MKRGLFIAFDGIDGCGKSTQVWKLAKYVAGLDKYNHVMVTREPYHDTDIRKILQTTNDPYGQAERLARLFIGDRKRHVEDIIDPNVSKGYFVITDRYSFSTLAYQQAQGLELTKLLEMHKGLPIPDIIFLVDTPVKEAIKRMQGDKDQRTYDKHKFEKDKEFIEKLRKNYLDLANLKNHKVIVVDGSKSIEDIFEKQIKPTFEGLYNSFCSK
jgi:dTMP kinase